MLETDYAHAESPKLAPEVPVRVILKSQLMAALRQHARPIIIEDPGLALPFTRMLRARELRLRAVGGLVAEAMSYAISRHYRADVEAHWYIGQYVLPGNVQQSRRLIRFVRWAQSCRRILRDTVNSASGARLHAVMILRIAPMLRGTEVLKKLRVQNERPEDRRRDRTQGGSVGRHARSRSTRARTAPSSSAKSSKRINMPTASTPRTASTSTCSPRASSIRPRSCVLRCRTPRRWACGWWIPRWCDERFPWRRCR